MEPSEDRERGRRAARMGLLHWWRGVRSRPGDPDRHQKCTGRAMHRATRTISRPAGVTPLSTIGPSSTAFDQDPRAGPASAMVNTCDDSPAPQGGAPSPHAHPPDDRPCPAHDAPPINATSTPARSHPPTNAPVSPTCHAPVSRTHTHTHTHGTTRAHRPQAGRRHHHRTRLRKSRLQGRRPPDGSRSRGRRWRQGRKQNPEQEREEDQD